jgi:diacylglycerol kinase (ATP)
MIMESGENISKEGGLSRLIKALGHQYTGVRYAIGKDPAIRQELGAMVVLVPLSALLPVGTLEHLILVLSMMLVVLIEFVNSAIEATVDRISTEHHPLSGQAKDLSSVAVAVAVLMSGLCWVIIAGPVAIQWLSQ